MENPQRSLPSCGDQSSFLPSHTANLSASLSSLAALLPFSNTCSGPHFHFHYRCPTPQPINERRKQKPEKIKLNKTMDFYEEPTLIHGFRRRSAGLGGFCPVTATLSSATGATAEPWADRGKNETYRRKTSVSSSSPRFLGLKADWMWCRKPLSEFPNFP